MFNFTDALVILGMRVSRGKKSLRIVGGGDNHPALADNHSLGSVHSVRSSCEVITPLTQTKKKKKKKRTDTELRPAIARYFNKLI